MVVIRIEQQRTQVAIANVAVLSVSAPLVTPVLALSMRVAHASLATVAREQLPHFKGIAFPAAL